MYEFHRVFTQWDETLWVGVSWFGKRHKLTTSLPYTTLTVAQQGEVCLTMPNGVTLCDYGPEHDHDRP